MISLVLDQTGLVVARVPFGMSLAVKSLKGLLGRSLCLAVFDGEKVGCPVER